MERVSDMVAEASAAIDRLSADEALAVRTAQDMSLEKAAHIVSGFSGWRDAGGATEKPEEKTS